MPYDHDEWAAHAAFDPEEEGECYYCGQPAELDAGACESCHYEILEDPVHPDEGLTRRC